MQSLFGSCCTKSNNTVNSNDHGSLWTNIKKRFRKLSLKEIFFIVVVLLTEIGCNISLDTPGALQNAIIKNYHLTTAQFSLLYTLYFIPTILLNGCSGFLIDRVMGIKLSTFVYSIIALLGCILLATGGIIETFWLMLMGRLIFGLGNELATGVCVNYCIFAWYRNSIMNIVSSLSSDGSLGGTLVIYQVGQRLLDIFKRRYPEKQALDIVICLSSGTFLITGVLAVLLTFLEPNNDYLYSTPAQTDSLHMEKKNVTFKDILHFPAVFWVLCLLSGLNATFNSFNQMSQGLLTSGEFGLTVIEASNAIATMGAVKISLSLPLSIAVDIFGRNTWFILVAQAVGTMTSLLFVLRVSPFVGMNVYNWRSDNDGNTYSGWKVGR